MNSRNEATHNGRISLGLNTYDLSLSVHVVAAKSVAEIDYDYTRNDHEGSGTVNADRESTKEREKICEVVTHSVSDGLIKLPKIFCQSVHDSAHWNTTVEFVKTCI